jgi:ABC-type antimicrobial peptide transport system permease subunit
MFRNYVIIAFRNLKRNFNYAALNVIGLTLSIAACLIIFLVTKNELTYDLHHHKAERTYRVTLHALDYNPSVSMAVAPAMRTSFPELETVAQYLPRTDAFVKVGEARYKEKAFAYGDQYMPEVFDYTWLRGSAKTALSEPNTVVLTESLAHKYFGAQDPMGQVLRLNNHFDLKVSGVIKDLPANTSQVFGFMISFATIQKEMGRAMEEFYAIAGGETFIVTPPNFDISKLQSRMKPFIKDHWGAETAEGADLPLQPLKDIHFDQRYIQSTTASRQTYMALIAIAIFIIVTACINFINLATAQAVKRAKETGVRKVLGANRGQLIRQFLGETAIIVFTTILAGLIAAYLALPPVAAAMDVHIGIQQLNQPIVYLLLLALGVVIVLLAGLYPAFVQSSFQPALTMKGTGRQTSGGLSLRKSLVFVQFLVSQVLIIGTLVVAKQMDFFKNQDLGFDKEAIITMPLMNRETQQVLAQQLKNIKGVKEISFSSAAPSYNNNFAPFSCPERGVSKDDVTEVRFIDDHYLQFFNIKLLAGTNVSNLRDKDSLRQVVVNETLLHKLGLKTPEEAIGMNIRFAGDKVTINGVVQDFQSESKHKERRPCVLIGFPRGFNVVSARLYPKGMHATLTQIEQTWAALYPDGMFDYEFLDDHIAALYKQEQKVFNAYQIFSILAIVIGCLGLYGLVAFAAVQRNKEVGIRKILGASGADIVTLLGKEFIILIAVAFLVATPLSYFLMHNWLGNFAYHISLQPGIFFIALSCSVAIAALTIAHQSVKAAVSNPLRSIKTE